MKRTRFTTMLLLGLLSLFYVSCNDLGNNEGFSPGIRDEQIKVRVDSISLTQGQIDSIDYYVTMMCDSSNSAVRKIANSAYSDSKLDTLGEFAMAGVFTVSELRAITDSIAVAQAYLYSLFHGEPCSGCTYSAAQQLAKLREMAQAYRDDPEDFDSRTDPKKRKFGDNPGCSLGFYVCLAGCSGLTGAIGAVACVYVCACTFCEYKPPGCN